MNLLSSSSSSTTSQILLLDRQRESNGSSSEKEKFFFWTRTRDGPWPTLNWETGTGENGNGNENEELGMRKRNGKRIGIQQVVVNSLGGGVIVKMNAKRRPWESGIWNLEYLESRNGVDMHWVEVMAKPKHRRHCRAPRNTQQQQQQNTQ